MKKFTLIGEIADFDYHGFWGDYVSPRSVKEFLATLAKGEKAEIEINSPGGLVIQGVEIANAIKNSEAHIIAHVTGVAASMASVIACACDEIQMEEASFLMIHNPWGVAVGDAEELRKNAAILDQMKEICMSFYRGKFKTCTAEQLSALMSEETWYTGNECLENGLECTVIASDVRAAAAVCTRSFEKIPEAAAKYLAKKELTDEGRAELDAARAKCLEVDQAHAQQPQGEENWEARYKGQSKVINALTAERDALKKDAEVHAGEFAAMTERAEKAETASKEFLDQVKNAGFENLAALIGAVSGLKADLEKSAKDLAECREQLEHVKETRNLLTGGVLTESALLPTLQEGLAKCSTPKEKSDFIASGKYRK